MTPSETPISRVTRTRAEARATYNRLSRWYDLLEGHWEKRAKESGLDLLDVKEGELGLEIGFGTGHGIIALAQSVGTSGKVIGIDLSPKMIELTRARLVRRGLAGRAELVNGDAAQLPLKTGLFDAVFTSFVLELFDTPEIPQVLAECHRILKSSGRICAVSMSAEGGRSPIRRLYEWGHRKFPKVLDCRPIFVCRSLEAAGFCPRDASLVSIRGLPVEIVLADRVC